MAGPVLTPQSFAQGCYDYPPSGGFPELPLLYFVPEDGTIIKDLQVKKRRWARQELPQLPSGDGQGEGEYAAAEPR